MSALRAILLGRIVDLASFKAIQTVTAPPDEEITDQGAGLGVVRLRDMSLKAFALGSGVPAWTQTPFAPCRTMRLAAGKVFAGCGNKVLSYGVATGDLRVVDPGPHAGDPIVMGDIVVSPHEDGRLNLYDAATGARRASKLVPELARALHHHVLADSSISGVCVLGLVAASETRWTYNAGCYDPTLTRRWTKALPMKLPRDTLYDVRQMGPRYLVLDDQSSPWDSQAPAGQGRGVLLRWRDGQVLRFDDSTFATVEDQQGDRLRPDIDVFARAANVKVDREPIARREARVVSDDKRAFVLIVNGGTALAGIDRATGHTLFLVPVPLGIGWHLELGERFPIVRTQFEDRWVVTVHDPVTGAVLYRDSRSPPRAD